jgi:hypothetical protein
MRPSSNFALTLAVSLLAASQTLAWTQVFVGDEVGSQVLKDYGVSEIPATFLIGPEGKVLAKRMRYYEGRLRRIQNVSRRG